MARKKRGDIGAFSLSFLDCICCGFGAIILLIVLSKIYEPVVVEESEQDLRQLIALLQQELFDIRGTSTILDPGIGGALTNADHHQVIIIFYRPGIMDI